MGILSRVSAALIFAAGVAVSAPATKILYPPASERILAILDSNHECRGEAASLTTVLAEKLRLFERVVSILEKDHKLNSAFAYTYDEKALTVYQLSTNRMELGTGPQRIPVRSFATSEEAKPLRDLMVYQGYLLRHIQTLREIAQEKVRNSEVGEMNVRHLAVLPFAGPYRIEKLDNNAIRVIYDDGKPVPVRAVSFPKPVVVTKKPEQLKPRARNVAKKVEPPKHDVTAKPAPQKPAPPKVEAKKPEPPKPAPKVEAKKPEPPKPAPKVEAPKPEPPKPAPKVEAKKPEPPKPAPKAEAKKPEPPPPAAPAAKPAGSK